MAREPTKHELIVRLHKRGWSKDEIANAMKCSVNYVDVRLHFERHPLSWRRKNQWMANKRASDPEYRARELEAQRVRYRERN